MRKEKPKIISLLNYNLEKQTLTPPIHAIAKGT